MKFESNTKFSLKKVSSAKWRPFLFRGDDLWLLIICTGGGFSFDQKYIIKPLERNVSLYNLVWGSIKPVWLLQPSLLHRLMSCYCKHLCTNNASQISHPYDIDTYTIKEQCLSLEMFNLEIVPYHALCLYVEYAVLCGNKVLLNLNLNTKKNGKMSVVANYSHWICRIDNKCVDIWWKPC